MSIVKNEKGLSEDIFMQQFPNYEHFTGQVVPPPGSTNHAQVKPPANAKLPTGGKKQ